MPDERIELLNAEIREHEEWLKDHPNHPADDKVQVRLSLVNKTIKRDELMRAILNELVNKEHEI